VNAVAPKSLDIAIIELIRRRADADKGYGAKKAAADSSAIAEELGAAMTSSTAQPRPHSLSEDRQTNEPSMEEILASIRRLIAEDEAELGGASASSEGRRQPPNRAPQAWTTAAPATGEPEPMSGAALQSESEVDESSSAPIAEAEARSLEAAGRPHVSSLDALIAADERLARQAPGEHDAEPEIATLAEPIMAEELMAQHEAFLVEEAEEVVSFVEAEAPACAPALVSADAAASITAQFQSLAASRVLNDTGLLHEYTREMLRPMLRAWLDDNLPTLVERLVRAEIERVARGGRR
jgi:cell pole-organizing protein PopZ